MERYIAGWIADSAWAHYSGGAVFDSLEDAKELAKSRHCNWAVLQLFGQEPEHRDKDIRVVLPYAIVAIHQSGNEFVYQRECLRDIAEKYKADVWDAVYCATLADYNGKSDEKDTWLLAFSIANGDYVFSYRAPFNDQPLGWCDGQYRVKVELPKIAKEPSNENC